MRIRDNSHNIADSFCSCTLNEVKLSEKLNLILFVDRVVACLTHPISSLNSATDGALRDFRQEK